MSRLARDHHCKKRLDNKMRKYPFHDTTILGSTSLSKALFGSTNLASEPPQRRLEAMGNGIDEALDLLSPDTYLDDSSTLANIEPIPILDLHDGIRSVSTKWDSNDLSAAITDALVATGGMAYDLDPIPIHSSRMRVVEEVPLGSAWDPNDPTKDLFKKLFTAQNPFAAPAAAMKQEEEQNDFAEFASIDSPAFEALAVATSTIRKKKKLHGGALLNPEKWDERLQELIKFRNEFGHCLVPHDWIGSKPLAQFVKRQRYQFKLKCQGLHSTLSEDRMRALEAVGFIWNSHDAAWEEKRRELEDFSNQYGHCNVPSRYSANRQLAIWVRSQRRQYKLLGQVQQDGKHKSHMTNERFHKLKSMGFVFVPNQSYNKEKQKRSV